MNCQKKRNGMFICFMTLIASIWWGNSNSMRTYWRSSSTLSSSRPIKTRLWVNYDNLYMLEITKCAFNNHTYIKFNANKLIFFSLNKSDGGKRPPQYKRAWVTVPMRVLCGLGTSNPPFYFAGVADVFHDVFHRKSRGKFQIQFCTWILKNSELWAGIWTHVPLLE